MNIIGDHLEEPDFEKEENKNPPSVHHPKITMNTLVSIHSLFFFVFLYMMYIVLIKNGIMIHIFI